MRGKWRGGWSSGCLFTASRVFFLASGDWALLPPPRGRSERSRLQPTPRGRGGGSGGVPAGAGGDGPPDAGDGWDHGGRAAASGAGNLGERGGSEGRGQPPASGDGGGVFSPLGVSQPLGSIGRLKTHSGGGVSRLPLCPSYFGTENRSEKSISKKPFAPFQKKLYYVYFLTHYSVPFLDALLLWNDFFRKRTIQPFQTNFMFEDNSNWVR